MAISKPQAYNTTPKPMPRTDSLTNSKPSGVGYDVKKNDGVPTQSSPDTVGQGRNTGSNASDYQKYLNDGINPKDWRDPIADSAALNKQAQTAFEKQLKQISDMNQRAASKKGHEERQTQGQQQASNERIAQIQNQPTYEKKNPFSQSQATLQYNANTAEKLSRWASKEEQQAARQHDAKTIANQFKHEQRMAMKQRGHENRMAYNERVDRMMTRASNSKDQSRERTHQKQMQESQIQGDLERSKADSIARLREIEFQAKSQERLANKQIQGDIAKAYIGNALSVMGGSNMGGYW